MLAEDGDRQRNGENRRDAAERACDIWAHQTVGLEMQQRDGPGEKQSDARKQCNSLQIAVARVDKKWG